MIKILSVVLFFIFYNLKNECCGTRCVDHKFEMELQYENLRSVHWNSFL